MRFVEKVTVEQIYSSVLKARRVRNEAGWERMEPVVVAENPTASPVMNAIARAMRERLFTSERELANYLEADLRHLNGALQLLTGMGIRDFLMAYRARRGAELLACTGLEIGEVARACGYSLPNNFARVFAKQYKMSPSDYRWRYRPANYRDLYLY